MHVAECFEESSFLNGTGFLLYYALSINFLKQETAEGVYFRIKFEMPMIAATVIIRSIARIQSCCLKE